MGMAAQKKAGLLAFGAAALFAAAAWLALTPTSPRRFNRLPADAPARLSPFSDASGAKIAIETFRGRIVVLNLWAAWCGPCIEEMPSLDRLAEKLPQDRYAVIAVSQDRSGAEAARPAFERLALRRLQLYLDPEGKLGAEIGARGMPTTLILGPDGAPLAYREGAAVWDSDETVAYLQSLAKGARSS